MAVVKILSRHSPSYASLINYILKEDTGHKPQVFTHNLRNNSVPGWTAEFLQNESFRKHTRSDQVYLYHDILSFSTNEDKTKITKAMLDDIAHKYIELRGYDGMYIGAVHRDKEHVHIHFCTSGLAYRTGTAFRLSKEKLQTLKQDFQKYHVEKYPELTHSSCEHGKGKQYMNDRRYRAEQRSKDKEYIEQHLQACFSKAKSQPELLELLMRNHDIFHYERKGHIEGLLYHDTKFRLSRLGVAEQFTALPKESNTRHMDKKQMTERDTLTELQKLREEKREQERIADREVRFQEKDGTRIVTYNDQIKETVWQGADGKETVSYERIDESEREKLDEWYDTAAYYSEMNDEIEQEPESPAEVTEESRVMNELEDLREESEERDLDEMGRGEDAER